LPSGLTSLTANFAGDLFLDSTTVTTAVTMRKLATSIQFQGLPANLVNPVTVTATVSTPGNCSLPGPQGTIQFFDGDLLVGAQALNSSSSASVTISRPAGTRTLKVKYLGDNFRNPSESSRSVTFQ
jgi:hypothetical protein